MKTHDMRIRPTGETGVHSGRSRYRVSCLTCRVIVHESTTAPITRAGQHFDNEQQYDRPMREDETE